MDFRLWVVCDVDDGVSCRPLGYTCCRVSLWFWNERPLCGDVFALVFSTNSDTPPPPPGLWISLDLVWKRNVVDEEYAFVSFWCCTTWP